MRFEEHFCDSNHDDYSLSSILRNAKIRKVEGKLPDTRYHDYHVGGTTLCAQYAKRALIKATEVAAECDGDRTRKNCKYSSNYPTSILSSSAHKTHSKCSSVCV